MRFLPSVCFAAVVGSAEAGISWAVETKSNLLFPDFPACTCTDLLNGATEEAEALCEKFANHVCRPLNDDAVKTDENGGCAIDTFRCDPHKSTKKPSIKKPSIKHVEVHGQCPPIKPQDTVDPAATSGEWFVQQASTTAFFDALADKCYTQFYLFDLDVDENPHEKDVLFNTYAEKKTLPTAAVLEAIKDFAHQYQERRKLWPGQGKKSPADEAAMVADAVHGSPFQVKNFWKDFFFLLDGPGYGNFTRGADGALVRTDPLAQFTNLMADIEKGFIDLDICGQYKVPSDFDAILPCAAPAASRLSPPADAKWFFVFAGSIDKATGYLVEGLVGDDLMYEYAIVTGGAQVPLANGKCAPGAGFINGGYQFLSRFPTGEQKAIELLRAFTEAKTNIDVHTLEPVMQAGCTYKDSKFKGKDPFKKSVINFAKTMASMNNDFACPKVEPTPRLLTPPGDDAVPFGLKASGATGLLVPTGICVFVYFSTPFSGLDPSINKCAQQGYFVAQSDGETVTQRFDKPFSRKLAEKESGDRRKLDTPASFFVELKNINNPISTTEVVVVDNGAGVGLSLCGRVNSESLSYSLGSCLNNNPITPGAPPIGDLFTNWFILFLGVLIPGHMVDNHFVPPRLASIAEATGLGFDFLFEEGVIIVATGGQPKDPSPDGCNPGTEFIDSGLVVSSTNPDGIPPAGVGLIFEFLKEKGFNTNDLDPVKQGVKNGCAISQVNTIGVLPPGGSFSNVPNPDFGKAFCYAGAVPNSNVFGKSFKTQHRSLQEYASESGKTKVDAEDSWDEDEDSDEDEDTASSEAYAHGRG